jgi:GNAT superfamily N-acetyltransferase
MVPTDSSAPGTQGYVIRRMQRPELDDALAQAAAEGWNPGRNDAEAFWRADERGFFLGLLDGRPAASIAAVRYEGDASGPAFGFVGLYIVRQDLRGRGYGMRLWRESLSTLGTPTIGLDAVVAHLDTYRRDGFELARLSSRYESPAQGLGGTVGGGAAPEGLRPLAETPFAEVLAYDRLCFPARREAFLRAWTTLPGHAALGLSRGGRLAGYGVVRPCGTGSKIGPLFADDEAAAHILFHGLCAAAPQAPVYFDAPTSNPAAVRLAEEHGMRVVFQTGRMYLGPAPRYDLAREFGVTSFELG